MRKRQVVADLNIYPNNLNLNISLNTSLNINLNTAWKMGGHRDVKERPKRERFTGVGS